MSLPISPLIGLLLGHSSSLGLVPIPCFPVEAGDDEVVADGIAEGLAETEGTDLGEDSEAEGIVEEPTDGEKMQGATT